MPPSKRTPATAMTGALEDNSAAVLNPRVSKAKTETQESIASARGLSDEQARSSTSHRHG
jgi:hypothetical protein